SMLTGTVMALVVISITIMVVFRSFTYGLLSFLVNIMPATLALGLWGLFVGQVGISVSMVFAASLGIIVDYCLHFLSKYRRARHEQQLSAEQAIHYAFSTVGVALLVTTAVLGLNFAILGLSDFRINIDMGVLTAMTIVFALLAQLFYLPSLLLALGRIKPHI
ncbi:MAG: MMPL family transporter, partial [Nevskiales bacterium]